MTEDLPLWLLIAPDPVRPDYPLWAASRTVCPLLAVAQLQMPRCTWDTQVEQMLNRAPGCHILALQEEAAELPRSGGGRLAVRAVVKLSGHTRAKCH